MKMSIEMDARPAIYTPGWDIPKMGFKKGVSIKCLVVGGPWPVGAVNDDGIDIYFIIELEDGQCCYASPDRIKFVKSRFDEYDFGGAEQ